jgi:hypothetical protein
MTTFSRGQRVRLIHCTDEYTKLTPGTEGNVTFVDDLGTVHVQWDDGHQLGMVEKAGDRIALVTDEPDDEVEPDEPDEPEEGWWSHQAWAAAGPNPDRRS